jgi:RNA polymerase sigma-70 factor (ECF subfamily)
VDAATIEAARRGDRAARGRLLGALQDVWYRFCLSLLGSPDRAADATQETALRFLKQLETFRGDSQLQTWSLGIALNVTREIKRRMRSDATIEDEMQLATARSSVGFRAEQIEEHEIVQKLLASLPERQREALILRFFEDLSTEQTAAAMHCAQGTVKATVHQALRALRVKIMQTSPSAEIQ